MKRITVFFVAVTVAFLFNSIVSFAGDGGTKFYGFFHDTSPEANSVGQSKTWIGVTNPNDETAKIEIKYYMYSGSSFGSYTTSIPAHGSVSFRPSSHFSTYSTIKGSFELDAYEGSVTVSSAISNFAGDSANPGYSDFWENNDFLSRCGYPVSTSPSTFLVVNPFNYNDTNGDKYAWENQEEVIRIQLCNPGPRSAEVKMKYYDADGNAMSLTDHDTGDDYTKTLTLNVHETRVVEPSNYITTGTGQHQATFDVTKGALYGGYILYKCMEVTHDSVTVQVHATSAYPFGRQITAQ